MKRVLLIFLVAIMPVMSFAQPPTSYTYKDFDIKFKIAPFEYGVTSENTVALIGYDFKKDPNNGAVEIPSSVTYNSKSYSVTAINGNDKRTNHQKDLVFHLQSKITSIKIPTSVVSIGGFTFYGCKGMVNIEIPPSVEFIGRSAFVGCGINELNITSPDIVF